jgi:L-fuculose-phosphate aldolase
MTACKDLKMPASNSFEHPRDGILKTIGRVYRYGLTTISGGNVSMREENGDVWITPSRVDKGNLTRDDIILVHPDGTTEGRHPPSSELPLHFEIYRARPDIRAIIHAHPPALVAFSLVRQVPNTRLFHQARQVCGEAGFAPYELPGSLALGQSVAGTFRKGHNCVILENHGVAVGESNLHNAFYAFETLEFTGRTIMRAKALGEPRYLTDEEMNLPCRSVQRLAEFDIEAASSAEKELRRLLSEFVRRSYHQRLFISTEGCFSARLDDVSFLITPHDIDRSTLDAQNVVLVRDGKAEAGKFPSWAARLHGAIYRQHPEIGAVVNAYPVNATAFSVTGVPLNTRTIPESYVFLRHVGRISYGLQFQDEAAVARQITPSQPIVLLENDGVLITAADVLAAYNRLEVLESTAEALIDCRALGTLAPMSDVKVRELERAFLSM